MKRILLVALCVTAAVAAAHGQESSDRPKIGLALAGGGAKGISHIGVLKALEEMSIPVDYVAGTSMGAIIGGLYASGMNPDELAKTIAEIDWKEAMRDDPPRRDLSFRRKKEDERYLLDLEVGVGKGGLKMPAGLQTGQKLTIILQWLTRHVADVRDFDDLPTPFRCVAADINTGDAVVLGEGDLAWAMRASMAIPSIFTPVELDGRTLVDGGIVANVPVDVVRAMGADVVIAVDLGAALDTRSVQGWFGVYRQMMRMLTRKNMEPQLAKADFVLRPPGVSAFGTLDFSKVEEIYRLGGQAVEDNEEALAELAVSPAEYRRIARRHTPPPEPVLTLASIRLEGNERVDSRIIENTMTLEPGDGIDFVQLAEDISTVYGLGDFDRISFQLHPAEGGETDLVIQMQEKPWGPNYMHFGLFLDSDLEGDFQASALVNLNMTRLNERGAEWRNDLRVGRRQGLTTELYQPLNFEGHWFVAPLFVIERDKSRVFIDGEAVAEIAEETLLLNASVGYQSSRFAEGRLGLEIGRRRLEQETGSTETEPIDARVGGIRAQAEVDSLDSAVFPTSGSRGDFSLLVSWEELGADESYNRVEARFSQFFPRGRSRVFYGLEIGLPFAGDDLPVYDLFTLGGLGSLSGFKDDELRGQYKGVGRLGYYWALSKMFKVGGWIELGNVWQETDDIGFDSTIFAGTVFVGLESKVGPVVFAYALTDTSQSQLYLTMGRQF